MKNAVVITVVRILASAAVAGLAAGYAQYPHDTWIQIALTAFGVLGIHAVPAVGQQSVPPVVQLTAQQDTTEPAAPPAPAGKP